MLYKLRSLKHLTYGQQQTNTELLLQQIVIKTRNASHDLDKSESITSNFQILN